MTAWTYVFFIVVVTWLVIDWGIRSNARRDRKAKEDAERQRPHDKAW